MAAVYNYVYHLRDIDVLDKWYSTQNYNTEIL